MGLGLRQRWHMGQQTREEVAIGRALSSRARECGILMLALALSVVIGAIEYATGYELHVTAFFLVPVCWAGWAVSRRAGLTLALVCAAGSAPTSRSTSTRRRPRYTSTRMSAE